METEEEIIYHELYNAVTGLDTLKITELMKQKMNLGKRYGKEGNIMCVAISKAGPEQLTALLEVDYHKIDNKVTLSSEKYNLINEPCNDNRQTPLMISALFGKTDALIMLLHYGADVNVTTNHMRAIDYALNGKHSYVAQTVLLLLKADSLFPVQKEERMRLQELVKDSEEIKTFFNDRDSLHRKLKERPFDMHIKNLIDEEPSSYYLNSTGQSALWEMAGNYKFETWAYLKYRSARNTGVEEKDYIQMAVESQQESFSRALAKYFFKVRGTQVMKMVSKSRILGDHDSSEAMGEEIEGYFKYLNGNEITSALLRILHDEIDFEVIFDIGASDVSRMIAISGEKVRGLTEFNQNRVYVGTKLNSNYEMGDMLGTLAHELAHKALAVVFKNYGKPYGEKNDDARKENYMKVFKLLNDRVWSKNPDDILARVNTRIYPREALEQELIVRVPHMIAKYGERDENMDGFALLKDQFPELLNYYTQWVMPAIKDAISASCTNYRMTVKDMSEFYKCLKPNIDDKIRVSNTVVNFKEKLHHHNGLRFLKVSNLRLGLSHLKAQLENEVTSKGDVSELEGSWHEPLFLNWQQFKYQWSNVMKALCNRAVSTLVISWNSEKPPIFCRRKRNCHPSCIYQEIVKDWVEEQKSMVNYDKISENIIIVLSMDTPSLKDVETLNYSWNDLSDKTKDFILSRQLLFQGKKMNARKIFSIAATNDNIEDYMSTNLSPLEISYLLEESKICISEDPGWSSEEKIYKNAFYHKDYYIDRSFVHRIVCKEAFIKAPNQYDIFFIRNASIKDMVKFGVKEEFISVWNPCNIDRKTQIYLSIQSPDSMDTKDIIDCFHGHGNAIHFVTFNAPYFRYDWSFGSINNVMDDIMDIMQFHNIKNPNSYASLNHTMDDELNLTEEDTLTEEQFIFQEITEDCGVSPKNMVETLRPTLIADNSGTGKSFVMNNMAAKLKKKLPYTWVTSTNLNFYAYSRSRLGLEGLKNVKGDESVIKFLFGMDSIKGSSLEMILFQSFARKKGGIIALFDGFDEICPNYKYEVIGYLKELSKLATIKICITTRLTEKCDLQKSLDCVAFRLVPFKIEKQNKFLNLFWNASLKNYPQDMKQKKIKNICDGLARFSKINPHVDVEHVIQKLNARTEAQENGASVAMKHEMIDFENFAEMMIKKISSQHKDKVKFTEIPLHAFMVATVVFEDNFTIAENWNLSQLYERFLHIKMKIFDQEKSMSSESVAAGRSAEMAKKSAYKILGKLSANFFIQPVPYICSQEEIEDAVRVGLVKDVMGSDQFLHRSFIEFFFAKWLIRKAKKKNITLFWLTRLFFDSSLSKVWWFLDDLLELQPEVSIQFKASVLSEEDLWRNINACLYVIIAVTFPSILHLFVNEFGIEVVRLLLKENNFPEETDYPYGITDHQWFTYPTTALIKRPLGHGGKFNAFQLIVNVRCCSGIEEIATEKVGKMTKKLLKLISENDLVKDLSQKLSVETWDVFIPEIFLCKINLVESYLSEIVNFLIGEHQEVFRDNLKQLLLHETYIWQYLNVKTFWIMDTLASSILQEPEYVKVILKNIEFNWLWNRIVRMGNLVEIEETWNRLSSKMNCEERVQFLRGCIGIKMENHLSAAFQNPNDDVWPYMWNLAASYMPTEDCKKIIQSAVQPEFTFFITDSLPHCYKFLEMLISTAYLNERELVDLFIPTKDSLQNPFLDESITITQIFHLHQFLSGNLQGATRHVFSRLSSIPYLWSIAYSFMENSWVSAKDNEFSEQMMTLVGRYDEIVDSMASSPLVDLEERERLEESTWLKFCIALFHDFLEIGRKHLDSSHFIKFQNLQADFNKEIGPFFHQPNEFELMLPNIFHIIQQLDIPFIFGLLSSILLNFITCEEMNAVLFAVNANGDTAFHIASRSHRGLLGKLQTLATETIGEDGIHKLLQVKNKKGFLAQDLLHNADHSFGFTTCYDV